MSRKFALGLALAGSLAATGAEAAIDKVKSIGLSPSQFAPTPVIRVANDGHEFTHVVGSTTYTGVASVECKGLNKVQNKSFGLGQFSIGNGYNEATNAVSSAVQGGAGGKSWSGGVSVNVPAEDAALGGVGVFTDPVALCNVMKDNEVAGGRASWDVLKNGMSTNISKKISFAARCQRNNANNQLVYWEQKTIEVDAILECEGNPSVQSPSEGAADQFATPFQIMEAELDVDDEVEGYCTTGFQFPVGLKIKSNGMPGDASFRLAKDGNWGGVTNLKFTKKDVSFETEVMFNVPPTDMGADGDLEQFTLDTGSQSGPIDSFASDGPKVHELKLAVLEPHSKVWDTKSVKIKCTGPKLNPAIVGSTNDLASPTRDEPFTNQQQFLGAQSLKIRPGTDTTGAKIRPGAMKIAPKDRTPAGNAWPVRIQTIELDSESNEDQPETKRGLKIAPADESGAKIAPAEAKRGLKIRRMEGATRAR